MGSQDRAVDLWHRGAAAVVWIWLWTIVEEGPRNRGTGGG
jgi:hypothetical protein